MTQITPPGAAASYRPPTPRCPAKRASSLFHALTATLLLALPPAARAEPNTVDTLIPWLLDNRADLTGIPFSDVIAATTGHKILPVDPVRHADLLSTLGECLDATLKKLNQSGHPIQDVSRVNEASRFVEDELLTAIAAQPGWTCTIPTTADGTEQRSGYPDLRVTAPDGTILYLDPKLYQPDSRASSLRTFYFEPRGTTGKVREDALHLLVGIEHNGETGSDRRLVRWEVVDLAKLQVQLKAEFQASNRDLYQPESIVSQSAP